MSRSLWTVVLVVVAGLLLAALVGPTLGFQFARIEGAAMAPALANQDRVIVNRWAYIASSPRRGDVVMLRYPPDRRRFFVKRVIAEGGDTVRIEDGHVFVNDVPLDDAAYVPSEYRSHDDFGPQVVLRDHYFVLGDHRNNSSDSRHWGQVPATHMVGRVALRWWPSMGVPR